MRNYPRIGIKYIGSHQLGIDKQDISNRYYACVRHAPFHTEQVSVAFIKKYYKLVS